MTETTCFKILRTPAQEFEKTLLFEAVNKRDFLIIYDIKEKQTYISILGCDENESQKILRQLPIDVSAVKIDINSARQWKILIPYRNKKTLTKEPLADIFDSCTECDLICVAFLYSEVKEIEESKRVVERIMSERETAETSTPGTIFGGRGSRSYHKELFLGSEEVIALTEILESLNMSLLGNGIAYKVYVLLPSGNAMVDDYLSQRFVTLKNNDCFADIFKLRDSIGKNYQIPYGPDIASIFLCIPLTGIVNHPVMVTPPFSTGDLIVGSFMKHGVTNSDKKILLSRSSLNLGVIISGLPGSGKTSEAKAIIDQLLCNGQRPWTIILSPTSEWNEFARSHKMNLVKLCQDHVPINFFFCTSKDRERFYEDLSMLLSSASDAGPYRNPMEKCMINAFRRVYSKELEPDPASVYNEIENSVVRFHGKRTSTGIKYTKHGENIRSSLENIRNMLGRPEYAATCGIQIADLLSDGIVFDMSSVSGKMKPYMYALILNQVYSIASEFDTNGDDTLRLLICVEEAQIIFGERDSPAVTDLKRRIQDFRKQGISLFLMAHGINEIEQGIRRLCQIKLYLKQPADVAGLAARDLVFTYMDDDATAQKLKHLDSRIGALSYILKEGTEKISPDTTFIRTIDYRQSNCDTKTNILFDYMQDKKIEIALKIPCTITINLEENENQYKPMAGLCSIRIIYLGEEIVDGFSLDVDGPKLILKCNLIPSKRYQIDLLDKKGKTLNSKSFTASEEIIIY
jgi:hypothetical protein